MRLPRRLAASVGFALLLTTAASTTYAQSQYPRGGGVPWYCTFFHLPPSFPGCSTTPDSDPDPSPAATPELDSLLLFGFGLTGLGGYAVTRYRGRRRP